MTDTNVEALISEITETNVLLRRLADHLLMEHKVVEMPSKRSDGQHQIIEFLTGIHQLMQEWVKYDLDREIVLQKYRANLECKLSSILKACGGNE